MNDDTNEMEALLNRFRPAGPDAATRQRVVRLTHRRSRWAFTEAMAAMLLIGMSLAQIGASITPIIRHPPIDEVRTQRLALAIAQLDLPIDRDEAYAMARRLAAGERLVPLPLVHASQSINTNNGALP